MLGFATRAGKIIVGTDLVCRAMPSGKIKLAVISGGASDSTKKKLTVKSEFYGVKSVVADIDTEQLGRVVGKSSSVAAVAVTEEMFAREILKLFNLVSQKGYTLVPLSLYFSGKNCKVEVGLCRGKKLYDKRDVAAEKQANLDIRRETKGMY